MTPVLFYFNSPLPVFPISKALSPAHLLCYQGFDSRASWSWSIYMQPLVSCKYSKEFKVPAMIKLSVSVSNKGSGWCTVTFFLKGWNRPQGMEVGVKIRHHQSLPEPHYEFLCINLAKRHAYSVFNSFSCSVAVWCASSVALLLLQPPLSFMPTIGLCADSTPFCFNCKLEWSELDRGENSLLSGNFQHT